MDLDAARAERRAVLGHAHVDASPDDALTEQVTAQAWGTWARRGPLSRRDRSLLVMAMLAALGRSEELALHAGTGERTGVTPEELEELLLMVAAYCGAPAALAARRAVRRAEVDR